VTLTVTANDPARNLFGVREVTGGLGESTKSPVLAAAVSGASFAANTPLAPGSIISLFGVDLANGAAGAGVIPLGGTLAGASVVMAGRVLPIIYSSTGQINAVVSAGINFNTRQQIVVQRDITLSVPISVDVASAEPAIFGYPFPGDPPNQGAILNAVSYVPAHPATPATAGDILAIFCTGLGAVNPAVPDGAGAPSSPPAATVATPSVSIGGRPAKVPFSGLSPGFVGLYQIDVIVPDGITPGNQVPVVLSIAGQTGPAATIAVK
jgi:adhesin/invasin